MKALILAAGIGERLKPHTLTLPKPSIPFLNIPMMAYSLFILEQIGLDRLVVNTHHLPEKIESTAKLLVNGRYDLKFSSEQPKILDSAGGIREAGKFLKGDSDFLVANGDSVIIPWSLDDPKKFVEHHKKSGALASIWLCPHPKAGTEIPAVWVNEKNEVKGFGKSKPADGLKPYHYIGVLAFKDEIFSQIPEGASNIFYDVLVSAIARGEKVSAFIDPSVKWFETGNEKDYLDATKSCLDLLTAPGALSETLHKILSQFQSGWDNYKVGGVFSFQHLKDKEVLPSKGLIGRGAQIDPSARIKQFAVLGPSSQVEKGSQLEGLVLGPSAKASGTQSFKLIL